MKRIILFLIFLAVVTSGCTSPEQTCLYGCFGDERRTSYANVSGLTKGEIEAVWKYHRLDLVDETMTVMYNTPVVDGGVLYLGGRGVYAISLKNGEEIWHKRFDQYLDPQADEVLHDCRYAPVVCGEKLFVVVNYYPDSWKRQRLFALDKRTGELLWQSREIGNDKDRPFRGSISGFPVVIEDKLYLPALNTDKTSPFHEAGVWVFDVNTGNVLDKIFLDEDEYHYYFQPVATMLAAEEANLYGVVDIRNTSYLFLYDTKKKEIKFKMPIFDFPGSCSRIAIGNDVIAVSIIKEEYPEPPELCIKVYDKLTQKLLWEKTYRKPEDLRIPPFSYLALDGEKLYTASFDGRFLCLQARSGEELWSYSPPLREIEIPTDYGTVERSKSFAASDIFATKNVVYFNGCNAIYALDPDSGQLLWKKDIEEGKRFINLRPIEKGLIVHYTTQICAGPPEPPYYELWREK